MFAIIHGDSINNLDTLIHKIYPSIEDATTVLEEYFDNILGDADYEVADYSKMQQILSQSSDNTLEFDNKIKYYIFVMDRTLYKIIKFTKFEHTKTERRVNLLTETRTEKKYAYFYGFYDVKIQVPVETIVEHSTTVVETKSSVIDNIKIIE